MERPTVTTNDGRKIGLREWPLRKKFLFGREVVKVLNTLAELEKPQALSEIAPKLAFIVSTENENLAYELLALGLNVEREEALLLIDTAEVSGAALTEVIKLNLSFLEGLRQLTKSASVSSSK